MKLHRSIGIEVMFVVAIVIGIAPEKVGAELSARWFTVDGGGYTFSEGGHLTLGGTAGQADCGSLSGGGYALLGGFWLGGDLPMDMAEDPLFGASQASFQLLAGAPNPFRNATAILLSMPDARWVSIQVYDYTGRLVRELHDQMLPPGQHTIRWDGRSGAGKEVASGAYLLKIRAGRDEMRRTVILMR